MCLIYKKVLDILHHIYKIATHGTGVTCGVIRKPEVELGRNLVKGIREKLLMSKAELARKAGVSPLTIDRVEKGKSCRMETKRKIILALGYELSEKQKIFPGN